MQKLISLLFMNFIIFWSHAVTDTTNDKLEIALDYQVQQQVEYNDDILNIKYFLEDYVNANEYDQYKRFWNHNDDDIITFQYDSLPKAIKNSYPNYKPSLFAIETSENDHFLVKISITGNKDGFYSTWSSHNLILKTDFYNCYKIINTAEIAIRDKHCKVYNNITFYITNENIPNKELKALKEFEKKLTRFLDLDYASYKIAVFNDTKVLYHDLGYDYHHAMYMNEGIGGVYLSYDNLILSGNGSAFYPHEMVHLYVNKLDFEVNDMINEGFATFLGGSIGHDYIYHIKNLKKYSSENKINLTHNITNRNKYNILVGKSSSFKYAFGAFLCHVVFKHKGRNGILKLLNSGKSGQELKSTILKTLNLEEINLEDVLQKELSEFKNISPLS